MPANCGKCAATGRTMNLSRTMTNAVPYAPWSFRESVLDGLTSSSRSRETVHQVLESIVAGEGPIHTVRLAKLVCAESELKKVNSARAEPGETGDRKQFHVDRAGFAWPTALDPATCIGYQENEELESRKIAHVSLGEIGNAMAELCRDAAGLEPDELKSRPSGSSEIGRAHV